MRAIAALGALLLIAVALAAGAIALGSEGYHALTHEELAAHLSVLPSAPQRFAATVRFANGRVATYELAGDELYLDAHILKWKPLANFFGLNTAYELDRVAGRYRAVEEERSAPRTVYSLAPERVVDLFSLRRRFAFLTLLLDAEYGSATFAAVAQPAELELRVSTTGLLLREATAVKR